MATPTTGAARAGARLHDAVDVMNIVAVRGDILHIHREHIGKLAGGALHDVQKILRSPKNVALLHRLGDGKAPGVDDAVTLSGVDGEDSVQLRGYLLLIT